MSLLYLALRGVRGRPFRSLLIGFFIFILAGSLLVTTVILWGMEESLRTGRERLGPDLVVIPYDPTEEAQAELMSGNLPTKDSLPADHLRRIREMKEVKRASPQLYLGTVAGPPPAGSRVTLWAIDPKSDFTVLPWLKEGIHRIPGRGEAVGGAVLQGMISPVRVNGYPLNLAGCLEATSTWLDRSLFVSFETAREMISRGFLPGVPLDRITSVSVELQPGADAARAVLEMIVAVPGVWPVRSPHVMSLMSAQRSGLMHALVLAMAAIWAAAVLLSGFLFSLIVRERRREIGVLRASGASRRFIFRLMLAESSLVAAGGGAAGIMGGGLLIFFLRSRLISALDLRVLIPPGAGLLIFMLGCFALSLVLILPALLLPAARASRLDPAPAMRGF